MTSAFREPGSPSETRSPVEVEVLPNDPALPGVVMVCDSDEELVEEMGRDLLVHSLNCVRSFGDFQIALSGGSTPAPLYRHLMIDPMCRGIPWRKSHLWLVDERFDVHDGENSTWSTVSAYFADHSGIPRRQQHPVDLESSTPAEKYEAKLRSVLEWRERGHDRLDYVLLGMDERGGTASLLPETPALAHHDRLVTTNTESRQVAGIAVEQANADRVTMTFRMINAARFVAIMVTGPEKRDAIGQLSAMHRRRQSAAHTPTTSHDYSVSELPIRGVAPVSGTLKWYLTRDACPR